MKVGIVGGGIGGMTAAYELARHGAEVSLFEAAPALGGQAATFEIEGARLERFYHHLFMSDLDMIDLVEQLGISDRLLWIQPKMGLYHQGRVHEFGTARSLLRLPYLTLLDKFRFGLVTLFLMRFNRYQAFEGISAWDWLRRMVGRNAFDVIWGPMLSAKFSRYSRDASMVWFWGKIALRGASRQQGRERLGYFNLSFQVLIDALAEELRRLGVEMRTSCPVQAVVPQPGSQIQIRLPNEDLTFDRVVLALHNRDVLKLAPALPKEYVQRLGKIQYEGASCLLLSLEQPLSPIYWMNISAPDMPFTAVVEHTNFMPPERYGGKHIVYLSRYMPADDSLFGKSLDEFVEAYEPHLRKIQPRFDRSWVRNAWLFKDSQAQPIITTGYGSLQPDFATPIPNLYLTNTTQIYPEDRGTNYAVRLGRQVAALILGRSSCARYQPMVGAGKKPAPFVV